LQRYRHVVARKRQHGLTTTLIYATTPWGGVCDETYEFCYQAHHCGAIHIIGGRASTSSTT
ncbi:hypothetical protein ACQCRI_22620, partial [Ralstonia pseudosolanacearum]|uniref:hypothetical protein n=1 Tax=Ralstonia pseudosolanacearum TaxID=1310165 RepID=UPI003CED1E02